MQRTESPTYEHLIPQHKYSPRDVFKDAAGLKMVRGLLSQLFAHLGLDVQTSGSLVEEICSLSEASPSDLELETSLKTIVARGDLPSRISERLGNRAEQILTQIQAHVIGNSVIDLGAGDGKVGKGIADTGRSVRLLDVLDYNETDLELELYDGEKIDAEDSSVDTSLILTVLHHCDQPEAVLDEAIRVTRGRIIILESIYQDEAGRMLQTFLDWFYNRVLHDNVNCPYNFNSPEGWRTVFAGKGLRIVYEEDLGRDQPTVPEHHWLFVLEKAA